jgi:hypothetical protein
MYQTKFKLTVHLSLMHQTLKISLIMQRRPSWRCQTTAEVNLAVAKANVEVDILSVAQVNHFATTTVNGRRIVEPSHPPQRHLVPQQRVSPHLFSTCKCNAVESLVLKGREIGAGLS